MAKGAPSAPEASAVEDVPMARAVPVAQAVTMAEIPLNNPAPTPVVVVVEQPQRRSFDSWSFPAFSVFGIPVRVHYLLLLYPLLQVLTYGSIGGTNGVAVALLVSFTLYLTVLVHELGHALMTRRLGGECSTILLWPLGGLAYCGHHGGYKEQMWISLAGPLTHLPQFIFWFIVQVCGTGGVVYLSLYDISSADQIFRNFTADTLMMQIYLAIFNLLPCYPLDGGQVLASFLMMRGHDANSAARVTCFFAGPLAVGLVVLGIVEWIEGWPAALITVIVGLWMAWQIKQIWTLVQMGHADQHPLFSRDVSHVHNRQASAGETRGGARAGYGGGPIMV